VILGNFLVAPGQHWEALDRHIIHPDHPGAAATTSAEPLTTFPDELDESRRQDAMRASARIRHERSREIGLDTRIDLPERSSSVRFSPVRPESPVQVAFVYTLLGRVGLGTWHCRVR
jgi:hypothetical protein